jgi:hypothetical protein
MKLNEISTGQTLSGVEVNQIVTVVATVPHADTALQLIYKLPDGSIRERLLGPADEQEIQTATSERPFVFDGNGGDFQLTCEAKRIDLAFLFDPMMAVHTSNVEPLPHQITEAFPWDTTPTFLIRDNDCAYGAAFTRRVRSMGIRPPYRASIAMAERTCRARNRLDPT